VILWKNNYAALKIIDVGIFIFFISLKYLFPFIFYLSGGKAYQPALIARANIYNKKKEICTSDDFVGFILSITLAFH